MRRAGEEVQTNGITPNYLDPIHLAMILISIPRSGWSVPMAQRTAESLSSGVDSNQRCRVGQSRAGRHPLRHGPLLVEILCLSSPTDSKDWCYIARYARPGIRPCNGIVWGYLTHCLTAAGDPSDRASSHAIKVGSCAAVSVDSGAGSSITFTIFPWRLNAQSTHYG